MKKLNTYFIKGLIVIVPTTLSIYILVSISVWAESLFGGAVKSVLGPAYYTPGLGIFIALLFIFLVGVLTANFLTGKLIRYFVDQFDRLPFLKAIYRPLRDLMALFDAGSSGGQMQKVVLVKHPHTGHKCLGLVTREEFDDLNGKLDILQEHVIVYIPLSYMLGGVSVIVPKAELEQVDIPVERALKLAITGWIKGQK